MKGLLPLSIATGLIMGSFLSVVIRRLHQRENGILVGRSQCPKCKHRLSPLELIPVLSFLALKGQCRHCKKRIPWHYLFLELSSAGLSLIFALHLNAVLNWLAILPILFVLLFIFFYDALHQEIHDAVVIPGILYAMAWSIFFSDWQSALMGAAVGIAFFGIQYLVSKGKWLGSGDILIGTFMGVFLGWHLVFPAIMISYVLGSLVGVSLLIQKKAQANSALALGPFLVMGTVIAYFYGDPILNWILNG